MQIKLLVVKATSCRLRQHVRYKKIGFNEQTTEWFAREL